MMELFSYSRPLVSSRVLIEVDLVFIFDDGDGRMRGAVGSGGQLHGHVLRR